MGTSARAVLALVTPRELQDTEAELGIGPCVPAGGTAILGSES